MKVVLVLSKGNYMPFFPSSSHFYNDLISREH